MRSSWTVKQPFGRFFKLLITLFIVTVIPLAVMAFWVSWALSPVGDQTREKIFIIKRGESIQSFSDRLSDENIIKSPFMFRLYLKLTGLDKKIQAGSFKLSANMSTKEISQSLTTGRVDKWVTLIEGLRKEEVAEIIAADFEIDKDEFIAKATEGELFPDTYLIPLTADEEKIIAIFKDNLDKKFDASLQNRAQKEGLTKKEVLILASIVERESRSETERPLIAGILIKRWREGMSLGTDATVQYALGYSNEEKTWWRKNLTSQDLQIESPYNTRKKVGLPPTPISNPGLSSISSVINPTPSPYYFYLHGKDGGIRFAKTFEEHQQNIADYL